MQFVCYFEKRACTITFKKNPNISRQSLPSLLGQIRASGGAQQEKQQICPCLRLSPNFCEAFNPTAAPLCSPHISVAHTELSLSSLSVPLIRGRGIHDVLDWFRPHTSEKPMTPRMCSTYLLQKIYCVNRGSAHLQHRRRAVKHKRSIWRLGKHLPWQS